MEMAAFFEITLLLLGCSILFTGAEICDLYAAKGQNFSVPLKFKLKPSNMLKWKHGNSIIVERKSNSKEEQDNIFPNGSLKLKNVNLKHAGKYTPVVHSEDGEHISGIPSFSLCVIDPVTKPSGNYTCMPTTVKFICTAGPAQKTGIKFEWLSNDKVIYNNSVYEVPFEKVVGPLSCRVSNEASSLTTVPVTHSCSQSCLVVLLIIAVIACCIHVRRKKKLLILEEEELRLQATNSNQQQQQGRARQHANNPNRPHHHNHHHNQRQHYHQPTGCPAPRQPHPKNRPLKAPEPPNVRPQSSPRRSAQANTPAGTGNDQLHPPLPQPRRKSPRTPRVQY